LLLLALISAAAMSGRTQAATRIVLVSRGGNGGAEKVLDVATALLSEDANLQLLDRAK